MPAVIVAAGMVVVIIFDSCVSIKKTKNVMACYKLYNKSRQLFVYLCTNSFN